ncbi:hypothetical protein [Streptomyces sp. bgisy095]|uniref:hypothetical protein n=1 Tax=unclassified Streptomyces TaxID=2593676 RepID=UPI003D70F3E2
MTDPDVPDFSGLEGGEEQQAEDTVRAVIGWYNTQLIAEQRSPSLDPERIEELRAGRQAALADQQQLVTADPQEAARIAEAYAARLKKLKES